MDDTKKREIIAILTVGCSRETAARYVGCNPRTINNAIQQDDEFAQQVAKAEEQSELFFIKRIRNAAEKEQYWRAAAWALERRLPNRYAARGAHTVTFEQVIRLMSEIAEIVVGEIQDPQTRVNVVHRLQKLTSTLIENEKKKIPLPEKEQQDEQ